MRKLFFSIAFLFITNLLTAQVAKTIANGFAIVELFTSQGCSSCPAAEKVLHDVLADAAKNNKPVYALSYHVDYWNKYGWKDPYSSIRFTRRQNNYVSATNSNEVYTPQVFVNGSTGFVGSDSKRLNTEIEKAIKTNTKQTLALTKSNVSALDTLVLNFTVSKSDANYNLVVAVVEKNVTTKINKGENMGKTLTQDNVVRLFDIFPLDETKGTIKLSKNKLTLNNDFSLIAFVQQKQNKKIVAATELKL
jgi:hypothetical protein